MKRKRNYLVLSIISFAIAALLTIGLVGYVNPEQITNPTFNVNVVGWTPTDCTIASVVGGLGGQNCLELTRTGDTFQRVYRTTALVVGKRYRFYGYVKSGTSGNEAARIYAYSATMGSATITFTSSASWVKHTVEFFAEDTVVTVYVCKDTATAGTMLFDDVSLRECGTKVKAAGFGTELITNPTFNVNTVGWSATNCTIASVAGGIGGQNCLEITRTGGATQTAHQSFNVVVGKRYYIQMYLKSGTSGNEGMRIYISGILHGTRKPMDVTSTANWVKHIAIWIAQYSESISFNLVKYSATAGTMLFDDVSFRECPTKVVLGGYGTELVLNGRFTTDVDPPPNWVAAGSALLTTEANGVGGGNCLMITENGELNPRARQDQNITEGKRYIFSFYVKQGTEATHNVTVQHNMGGWTSLWSLGNQEAGASWSKTIVTLLAPSGATAFRVTLSQICDAAAATTIYFDEVSLREMSTKAIIH